MTHNPDSRPIRQRQTASIAIPCTTQELARFKAQARRHRITHREILLRSIKELEQLESDR